jgi:hypothetical protein
MVWSGLGALYASKELADAIVPRTLSCSLPTTLTSPTNPHLRMRFVEYLALGNLNGLRKRYNRFDTL